MKIDSTTLEKALRSLQKALLTKNDAENFVRDSAIQRFEYTYGLAISIIKRQIQNMAAEPVEIDAIHFQNLLRTAAENGLVEDPVVWFKYREMRNKTSHTYNEQKAEEIYATLNDFAKSTEYLLVNIKRLNS